MFALYNGKIFACPRPHKTHPIPHHFNHQVLNKGKVPVLPLWNPLRVTWQCPAWLGRHCGMAFLLQRVWTCSNSSCSMRKIMLRMSRDPDWNQWPGHQNAKQLKKWCTMCAPGVGTLVPEYPPGERVSCLRHAPAEFKSFQTRLHNWLFQDFAHFL